MVVSSQLCNVILCIGLPSYELILFMFDKKETKDEKETLWQEQLLNCVMSEFFVVMNSF